MSTLDERVASLEQHLAELTMQLQDLQSTLLLVGDVQRYSRLRELLAAGELDAADIETATLLFDGLADQHGDVSPEALERCPAAMLQIIDGLWHASSHGRQGFSVQQQLYRELGGSRESLISQDLALFARFTQTVAWPTQAGVGFVLPDELTVPVSGVIGDDALPPRGHLPLRCWGSDYGLKGANLLMARLIEVFAA
jgi:hypothetical protein